MAKRLADTRQIEIHIRRLPEGVYLATCRELPGLTVETETRDEAQKVAPEMALELIELETGAPPSSQPQFTFTFD